MLLAGAAAVSWWLLFPSEERVIRHRFAALAADINAALAENGLGRMAAAARVGSYLTDDVRVEIGSIPPIVGRTAVVAVAAQAGTAREVRVRFADVQVTLAVGGQTASAYLTAEVSGIDRRTGARTIDAREVEVTLEKRDGHWVIAAATAVDTLQRPPAVGSRLRVPLEPGPRAILAAAVSGRIAGARRVRAPEDRTNECG